MKIKWEKRLVHDSRRILDESWDAIWCVFEKKRPRGSLKNSLLQSLDWELSGQLTRALDLDHPEAVQENPSNTIRSKKSREAPTHIPTLGRLPTPWVSLLRLDEAALDSVWRGCQGLGLRRILILFETEDQTQWIKDKNPATSKDEYPRELVCAEISPEKDSRIQE